MDWSRWVVVVSYGLALIYLARSWRPSKGLFGRPVLFLMMVSSLWWVVTYVWLAIVQPPPQVETGVAVFIRLLHLHVALSYIAAAYFSRKWATALKERAEVIAAETPPAE